MAEARSGPREGMAGAPVGATPPRLPPGPRPERAIARSGPQEVKTGDAPVQVRG